ncbi:MAG: response regulator [Nitrospiraceae bacterium]|nr:MAG: response regulator [Nitrospiraceae bacterium]
MENKLRIMIVDDEPIVGKRLKRLFEKEGFEVGTCTRGSVAIEELKRKHFDIVITDLMMGNVDGMKILEFVKTNHHVTRVIIITGFGKKETAAEAFSKGAFAFIIKPFKIDELREVVRKACAGLKAKSAS